MKLAALAALPVSGLVGVAVLAGATSNPPPGIGYAATAAGSCRLTGPGVTFTAQLTAAQVANAAIIDAVGRGLDVPADGEVIALAVALQESDLVNLPYGDRDSLGLFQQRPSQGWGTPTQVMNPTYAATQFYRHLLTVPGWSDLPLTDAAQAVQRSAFPTAYAQWQTEATLLHGALTGVRGDQLTCTTPPPAPTRLPTPTNPAAATAITFAVSQLGTPYQLPPHPPASWDCSSLVQAAYSAAGVTLPRTTYQQVSASGPTLPLTPTAWQPGDLLFTMGADPLGPLPGHVGIYLGDGQVLNAPHPGAVVTITPLAHYGTVVAATCPG